MGKILVVDDEQDICEILKFNIENEGYDVATANSAEEARTLLSSDIVLILLDVMMHGISGYQFAKQLRDKGNTVPIIFLTAKNTENDMLTGFSIGADDYIAKPFSIKEVLARINAILKRTLSASKNDTEIIEASGLTLNPLDKTVSFDGETILLTKKEFLIITLLLKHKGTFLTREEILSQVWEDDSLVLARTVDVHIARLRKKIGRYVDLIISRLGFGYMWKEEP